MKKNKKFIGLALLVVAVGIGYMGYSESQGAASSLSSAFSGSPTDGVMIKYIGAAVLGLAGLFMIKK